MNSHPDRTKATNDLLALVTSSPVLHTLAMVHLKHDTPASVEHAIKATVATGAARWHRRMATDPTSAPSNPDPAWHNYVHTVFDPNADWQHLADTLRTDDND